MTSMFDKHIDPKARELARLTPFRGCTTRQLEDVARLTDEIRRPTGWVMMVEDDVGHECFVIVEGEAVVLIDGEEVARLGPGDIVGEMALLDRDRRCATVIAETPLRVLVMTQRQFDAITDNCPPVAMAVMGTLAQRLREVQAAA